MNIYGIIALILFILALIWIVKLVLFPCCASNCPNKIWWWQKKPKPGRDVPRPDECCPTNGGGGAASAPAASQASTGIETLDHSATNTDPCAGATALFPPYPGGLTAIGTSCWTVGKSLILDITDCADCLANNGTVVINLVAANNPDGSPGPSCLIGLAPTNVQFWTGNGLYPSNMVSQTPVSYTCPLQVKYTLVSDTQIDLYLNGILTASFPKPSFVVNSTAFASCTQSNNYGAIK